MTPERKMTNSVQLTPKDSDMRNIVSNSVVKQSHLSAKVLTLGFINF